MKIFINPGHGKKANGTYDPGAVNGMTGLREADIVLAIGSLLNRKLQSVAQTYLYQSGDINPISATANSWGADWFVSIHCNSFADASAHGIETLYHPSSAKGQGMAQSVQTQLVRFLGRASRGIKARSDLGVLRDTKMPAILAEIGFISNAEEEALMRTGAWQENAAEALAIGICGYVGLSYSGGVQVPAPEPVPNTDSYQEPTALLQKGSTGDGVKWLQTQLNARGAGLSVDGDFGQLTDTAVRNFQRNKGLGVDGCVGANTRNALTCPYAEPTLDLRKGSTGNGVSWVQWNLKRKGYVLADDGDFGPITHGSILAFQKSRGLSQDGIVGPLTRNKLKNS